MVSPTDSNVVYVAAQGAGDGVYRSQDGGQTWTNTTTSAHPTGIVSDVQMDPSNPLILYAGFVDASTQTNGIWQTTNGGNKWVPLVNGLPSSRNVGNYITLAVAPSRPQTVYATIFDFTTGNPFLYRTLDSGQTWVQQPSVPGTHEVRFWHTLLAVDPTNSQILYANSDHSVYLSKDGGGSWSTQRIYGEDPVGGAFDATGAFVLVGNRGIHRTSNQGATWDPTKQIGLQFTELYDVTPDPYNVDTTYGIAQDHVAILKNTGNPIWNYAGGGNEAGRVIVDPRNTNVLYDYDPLDPNNLFIVSKDAGAT